VLVVDPHALEAVHELDFVEQVLAQRVFALYVEDVVQDHGAVGEPLASVDPVARLDVEVFAGRIVYTRSRPTGGITLTLRMPLVAPPSSMMPSMWLMKPGLWLARLEQFGTRADRR